MDARVLLFLIVLGTCWCCNARVVTTSLSPVQNEITSELQINHQQREREVNGVCTLCELVVAPVLESISNSTTQTEVMAVLHLLCALTFTAKDECNAIVDYYVPMIFSEASSLTPETLCIEIGLCETVNMSQHLSENSCEFCHHAVTEALLDLEHPDSQLQIVELLLKACNAMEGSLKNCKRLVLANAHLIPVYAKQLLKGHGICNLLQACSLATNATEQASSSETSMLSAY